MDLSPEKKARLAELDKLIPAEEAKRQRIKDEIAQLSDKVGQMDEEIDELRAERYSIKRDR